MRCFLVLWTAATLLGVSADRSVVVLYNNGVPIPNTVCSSADLEKTFAVLQASSLNSTYGYTRQLRSSHDIQDMTESLLQQQQQQTDHHRDLIIYPRKCKDLCSGQTPGNCQAIDCKGYRRNRQDRSLISGAAFTCTQQVDYINQELTRLVNENKVSPNCQTLLMQPRDISCFDDVIYGVVESVRLLDNSEPQQVLFANFTGQSFCASQQVFFEVIANKCVDHMHIWFDYPDGSSFDWWGYDRPYQATPPIDYKFNLPGLYTMTALPDELPEKAKVIQFQVLPGSLLRLDLYDIQAQKVNVTNFGRNSTVCVGRSFTWDIIMDACADSFRAVLTGPGTFTPREGHDMFRPFAMYGYSFSSPRVRLGKSLSKVGNYTLTVYPSYGPSDQVQVIPFQAVRC